MGNLNMEPANELDELDRQLREAAPYIDDDGFTRGVLNQLPAPGLRRQSVRALILLGASVIASISAYFLSGGGQFVIEGFRRLAQISPLFILAAGGVFALILTGAGAYVALSRDAGSQTELLSAFRGR
jgi:hypothetical protein